MCKLFGLKCYFYLHLYYNSLEQEMQYFQDLSTIFMLLNKHYLSRGISNVLAESILLAMARNINKLHNKIQTGRTGTHLFPIKTPKFRLFKMNFQAIRNDLLKYAFIIARQKKIEFFIEIYL